MDLGSSALLRIDAMLEPKDAFQILQRAVPAPELLMQTAIKLLAKKVRGSADPRRKCQQLCQRSASHLVELHTLLTLLRATKSFGKVLDLSNWDSFLPVLLSVVSRRGNATRTRARMRHSRLPGKKCSACQLIIQIPEVCATSCPSFGAQHILHLYLAQPYAAR